MHKIVYNQLKLGKRRCFRANFRNVVNNFEAY
jgi:hypothetical protein